jgi:3-hydroxyacyl-[acyl-carrier-protein] dehydratase
MSERMRAGSPLLELLEVKEITPDHVSGVVRVPEQAPFFAGHYPGFALVPGVFLLDLAHELVRRYGTAYVSGGVRLESASSVRFLSPVRPGDTVEIGCRVKPADGGYAVVAACATGRGKAASIRLRYRTADRP